MTKLRKLWCVGLVATLAFVSACNDDAKPDDAQPTDSAETSEPSSTSQTSTTPTTSADDYSVPAVIDAKYVDRVLAALNKVDGDALRLAIKENNLTREVTDRILAINTAGYADIALARYSDRQLGQFADVKPNPGDVTMTAKQIDRARPDCVFALVTIDPSASAAQVVARFDQYVVLALAEPAQDPHRYNPTPWAFDFQFIPEDLPAVPEDSRCGG